MGDQPEGLLETDRSSALPSVACHTVTAGVGVPEVVVSLGLCLKISLF